MAINVEFPDGEILEMASVSRELQSGQISGWPPERIEETAFDPVWRFKSGRGGKWFASQRP